MGKRGWVRRLVQVVWAALSNGYAAGFLGGKIYRGALKRVCLPGLNCYSCPGALGSCPIGALQAVLSHRLFGFSYYVVGFLVFVGALVGRFACGWLCPFGLVQELMHKIPFPKKIRAFRGDRALRFLKYAVLLLFAVLLPLFLTDEIGQGAPYFCKFVCPAGMLEGGLPLVLASEALRGAIGWLYAWKGALLAATLLLSVIVYRPFCRYLCPLGAVYGLFNPIAFYRLRLDKNACTDCGACARACGMALAPRKRANDMECVRCGDCARKCPTGALRMGFREKRK